jgi:transposase
MATRKPYPSDVYDEEWAFVAPYRALVREDAPQRNHDLRARSSTDCVRWIVRTGSAWRYMPHDLPPWETLYQQRQRWLKAGVFEAMVHDLLRVLLRLSEGRASEPTAAILDSRTLQSTPESGHRGGYDGHHKGKKGSKVDAAVDTLGHLLLALRVSPANEDDPKEVEKLSEEIQRASGENVELAYYVDQGYTGERTSGAAAEHGIRLEVVKHEEGGQEGIRTTLAEEMGGRTRFRVGLALSEIGEGL